MKLFKSIGYLLCMLGASIGGFPPPKLFAREELPEEELIRILEDDFEGERRDTLAEWGFRVIDPLHDRPARVFHTRIPETP